MMGAEEQAVRDTAAALHGAIKAAEAAGYRVQWPGSVGGLSAIAISETANVAPPPAPIDPLSPSEPPPPTTTLRQRPPAR